MQVYIKWEYRTLKGATIFLQSEWLSVDHALLLIEDFEKTGRVKEIVAIDEQNEQWTVKQLKKLAKKLDEEPSQFHCYFDGSYQKETKESGVGMVIYYNQGRDKYRLRRNLLIGGLTSNNEVEYVALYHVVLLLEEIGIKGQSVTFSGDSLVVLNQLAGEWPCYDAQLEYWLDKIERLLQKQKIKPIFKPIDRKQNKEADQLAKQAIEGTAIDSTKRL
ncbi:reverse transcriptase-like protein [Bacillus sp. FJAT-47783]|uniref:reverse transcriptase-like protein n=1 Tax=Bacillus sp. FJAT-47783 TaxID=2922712 RepID=UPI001FAB56F3|nr:reverse transcriptase-like protein [Bacillus sp. FJAT-47783]